MADELIQQLGFDAGNTLSTLSALEAGFNKFNAALAASANSVKAFNAASSAGMGSAQQNANDTLREAARIFEATRTPQERYLAQTQKLSSLLRSGAIDQATHSRAVQQAQSVLEKASQSSTKYGISMETLSRVVVTQAIVRAINAIRDALEFATVSQLKFSKAVSEIRAVDASRSYQQIAASITDMSNRFNQPLQAVGEAQYQLLSNQFTAAADRQNILTAANQLAKSTEDDLVGATTILTGSLNAFGESSESAGQRAAQFFKAITLGHMRTGELGTALGRVQSIAHELGVSVEELDAAMVSLSIGGLKASEAGTQLRSMLTALLKPSAEMKAALQNLNVESGEAAIRTWGLQGAFDKLAGTTDGSSSAIAKLVPNVRGVAGAFRLLSSGAATYKNALRDINAESQTNLGNASLEAMSTDAARLTAEFNKLKNYFTTDLGGKAVHTLNTLIDLLGRGNGLVRKAAGRWNNDEISNQQDAVRAQLAQIVEMNKTRADAAISAKDFENQEISKRQRQAIADLNRGYMKDAANYQEATKIEEKVNATAFERIMQSRQKMTRELFSISETAAKKASDEIPHTIKDIEQKMSDRRFVETLFNQPLSHQFESVQDRYLRTVQQAQDLQGNAKDANQEKYADEAWKRAEALQKQAEQLAKQSGNSNQLLNANRMLDDLDQRRLSALHQQVGVQEQLSKDAEERANQAEKHNLELDAMRRAIEEKLKPTTKSEQGYEFKSPKQYTKDMAEGQVMIEGFQKKLKEYGKEDFAKSFMGDPRAFESMQREAERSFASYDVKKIEVAPETLQKMFTDLQASAAAVRLTFPAIVEIEAVTGMNIVTNGVNAVMTEFEKKQKDETEKQGRRGEYEADARAARTQFTDIRRSVSEDFPNPAANENLYKINEVIGQMARLMGQESPITNEQAKGVKEASAGLDFDSQGNGDGGKLREKYSTMMADLIQLQEAQQKALKVGPVDPNLDAHIEKVNALTDAYQRANAAKDDAKKAQEASASMQCLGGLMRFDAGGFARGTDTIPAMLSAGEFVMSAKSTKQWYSQLVAMNAGVQPAFRNQGGNVTNVGDITVNVKGGSSGSATGREIAEALRRELRRGTSALV